MPSRALRPCMYQGCSALVRSGRYCQAHQAAVSQSYDAQRGSASRRGYGSRWRRLRMMYLREHPLCVVCAAEKRIVPATEVDHIVPKREGGSDDDDNLQALCKVCHSRKTAQEDGRWGAPVKAGVGDG